MWWLRARSSRAGSTRVGTPRMTSWPGTSQWRWRWRRGAQRLRRGGEGDSCAGPSAQEAPPRIAHRRGLAIHPPTRIDRPWDHPAVDSRSTSLRFVSLIDSTTSPADHFISEIRWIAETLGQHSENAQLCVVIGSTCVDRHRRLTPKSVHPRLACGRHVHTTCQPRNFLCRPNPRIAVGAARSIHKWQASQGECQRREQTTTGRVAAGSYPPAAPTDPGVPHSGTRLLR